MAKEIEKKFLVDKDKLPELKNGKHYIQGYLSTNPHIRFRVINDLVIITIKSFKENMSVRNEWEFKNKMSKTEISELLKLSVSKPIEKSRYEVGYEKLIWEIDVYQGMNEGLITVDVELEDIIQEINFPIWARKDMDITNDPKYFNVNLGNNPYSKWNNKQ